MTTQATVLSCTTIPTGPRPIYLIAREIVQNWDNIYFGAKPYLQAMFQLSSLDDQYGCDDARSIVLYFLSNAEYWRGPVARQIKKELNTMLKAHKKGK